MKNVLAQTAMSLINQLPHYDSRIHEDDGVGGGGAKELGDCFGSLKPRPCNDVLGEREGWDLQFSSCIAKHAQWHRLSPQQKATNSFAETNE